MSSQKFFNMGPLDRALRVIIGGALLSLAFYGPETSWGWLGLLPLSTAAIGWCPLYSLLGISSRRKVVAK